MRNPSDAFPARLIAYLRIFLAMQAMAALVWVVISHGLVDRTGKALGTDFVSFWSAGALADTGHPIQAYQPAVLVAMQQAAVPGQKPVQYGFFYPPPFLALCAVLAKLPYGCALLIWLAAGIGACVAVLRRSRPQGLVVLPFLAFPALWLGIGHGQTCFLVTALFGAALLWWDRAPVPASVCAALLVLKPHLAIMPPLLMLIERQWRMLLAWGLTIGLLAAGSTILFGGGIWPAFFLAAHAARQTLEQGQVDFGKMVSLFAAIRLLHGGVRLAWAVQMLWSAMALSSALLWSGPARRLAGASIALLISPFLLDYDLLLLALPGLAMLQSWSGLRPWQKAALAGVFILPLISRIGAMDFGVPLAPVVMVLFHVAFYRASGRAQYRQQGGQEQEAGQQRAAQAQQQQ